MAFLLSLIKPLAYMSLPIILLRSVANVSPMARYYVKAIAYATTMVSVASCSIFAAAGYSIAGRQHDVDHWVARLFYTVTSKLFNVHVEVEGEEHLDSRPAILMANHQSFLDILILGRLMPTQSAIVSKKSLQYSPLGPFMSMSGTIFIDRSNPSKAVSSMNKAAELVKKLKISLWIFPEGTRRLSSETDMLPLKKGGFHLAINSGIPIIPIVAENYYDLYHTGTFKEGTIKVKVLPPIPTVGLTVADVGELSKRVRDTMLEALHEISRKSPEQSEKAKIQPISGIAATEKPSPSLDSPAISDVSGLSGLEMSSSSVSLSSSGSISRSKSDNGTETEEDEGMILVGRPTEQ
ncbi:1-acylglycerol-3-phosphate O-acyltransferase [Coprinopsis marcescibilis]|uniref:1-acyl-sn-glycerol-3-phosphate acyltransferase n=1 Tax=Coprinopsis marcescibilis TaxID=230819 RepID=A0A5C3KB39_COPMA|nr:1-acylglycerol-3-phosphate O-acyltransferase [Coprinopsis marcescibilis]